MKRQARSGRDRRSSDRVDGGAARRSALRRATQAAGRAEHDRDREQSEDHRSVDIGRVRRAPARMPDEREAERARSATSVCARNGNSPSREPDPDAPRGVRQHGRRDRTHAARATPGAGPRATASGTSASTRDLLHEDRRRERRRAPRAASARGLRARTARSSSAMRSGSAYDRVRSSRRSRAASRTNPAAAGGAP